MSRIAQIARLLTESVAGKPYHGPSLLGALDGVSTEVAGDRPPWSAHSIWELVLHVTADLRYARAVIEGTAGPWVAGETTWPALPVADDAVWAQAIRELRREIRALVRTVAKQDDAILSQKPIRVHRGQRRPSPRLWTLAGSASPTARSCTRSRWHHPRLPS